MVSQYREERQTKTLFSATPQCVLVDGKGRYQKISDNEDENEMPNFQSSLTVNCQHEQFGGIQYGLSSSINPWASNRKLVGSFLKSQTFRQTWLYTNNGSPGSIPPRSIRREQAIAIAWYHNCKEAVYGGNLGFVHVAHGALHDDMAVSRISVVYLQDGCQIEQGALSKSHRR
jgi:hypothetical protein